MENQNQQEDPTAVQLEPKPQVPKSHMVLAYVLSGFFALALIAGIYYWQTTSKIPAVVDLPVHKSQTADWKTFVNKYYGYELKYPNSWFVDNGSEEPITERAGKYFMGGDTYWENYPWQPGDGPTPVPDDHMDIYLIVYQDDNFKNIDDYANHYGVFNSEYVQLLENREFNGGKQYITENKIEMAGLKTIITIFQKNSYFFVFKTGYNSESAKDFHNQILSTFKFTSPSASGDMMTSPVVKLDPGYYLIPLGKELTDGWFQHKLIKIDSAGKETILVPNVNTVIPNLNSSLVEFSFPQTGSQLYFQEVLLETDAPPGRVFAFDINTKKFTELKNASKYTAGFAGHVLSPDGLKVVSTEDPTDQRLFLIDLSSDSVNIIVTLSGKETFNLCARNCFGGYEGKISWVDGSTIRYSVYDNSIEAGDKHPLIAERTIKIN